MLAATDDITRLLWDIEGGRPSAADELFPLIYEELRQRASRLMAGERADHTLQPTALVHEAFLRVNLSRMSFESRLHFYNTVALAMRRILVNYAAARNAEKRGGPSAGGGLLSLDDVDVPERSPEVDILALDDALKTLEQRSSRQYQVVMLRYFAGMKDGEIAQVLGTSEKTVRRAWATAKLWLRAQVAG